MSNKLTTANQFAANVIGQTVAVGTSEFNEIIRGDALYVDKSLFIKDIIDNRDKAILITRPRRWGKTLNMSMLQHFFAPEVSGQNTTGLFDNLLISKVDAGKYMEHQGIYPVIFITFKDVKKNSLADIVYSIRGLINELYKEHYYLKSSDKIKITEDKDLYSKYLTSDLNQDDVEKSLKFLSRLLREYYDKDVYILIDEYDTPLNEAHNAKDFKEIVTFMKNLLSNALKGNPFLKKGIMTGILRVSKDSMLSGLNNLEVYTVVKPKFSQYFGFTDAELDLLFKNQGLEKDEAAVKSWYDGYIVNGLHIYNPWSILSCLKEQGAIEAYWLDTGSETLIQETLQNANLEIKDKLQELMLNKSIVGTIEKSNRFENLVNDPTAVWSMLLYTGYLTATSVKSTGDAYECNLSIPNKEIMLIYKRIFISWLGTSETYKTTIKSFLSDLIDGQIEKCAVAITEFLEAVASVHDYANQPEVFYHGFMLALTAALLDDYYIHSNKESGKGRPDLLFIPKAHKKNSSTTGVILEFKHVKKGEIAKEVAIKALEQINSKNYAAMISQHKYVTNIRCVALAFDGKHVECAHRESRV